jgi:hypothetical protein
VAVDPKILANLQELLTSAEADLARAQKDYYEAKSRVQVLQRAIEEHGGVPRAESTSLTAAAGPAERARAFLRRAGKPWPLDELVETIYQENDSFQLVKQGKEYIQRSITRACTGGTILYFSNDRVGLPEDALKEAFKDQVDWEKIRKKGFQPHHTQRHKLKELLPPEILEKLLSLVRR